MEMTFECKGTVLLVDDDTTFLFAMKHALQSDTLSIHTADTYEKAIEALKVNIYDAVISDVRLTGSQTTEGLRLLEYVRASCSTTRTIMITGYTDPQAQRTIYRLEADFYLEKPVSARVIQGGLKYLGICF